MKIRYQLAASAVALSICSFSSAAFAQSTGSVDFEEEVIVVSGSRSQDVAGIQAPDSTKAKAVLTQELIERSLFVVTLNSTVGIESLLLGKPVLTLGNAFFNIEGLVAHADSLGELLRLAGAYPNWGLDEELRCSFLHYLQHQYCVSGHWQEAATEHLQDVAQRIRRILLNAAS